jgi:hypothetical protein
MENQKELLKLAQVFNVDNIITNDDIEQVLKGVLAIMSSFKKDNQKLNKETTEIVENLFTKIVNEHDKIVSRITKDTEDTKEEVNSKLEETVKQIKSLMEEVKAMKPKDGKDGLDADEDLIVDKVLEKIKLPEYEQFILDEKGEQIIKEINTLPTTEEYQIDASHIKNLPKAEVKANGGGWRNLYQMHDVEIDTPTDNQVLTYDSASNTWKNENGGTGGGHTIQDEGTPLTQRTNLNFVGSGVAVTDDAGNDATVVTINTGSTDEKVKYDVGDPTAGYVADKFVAGTGISVAEGTAGNENKLVITNSAPDQTVAFTGGTNVTIGGTYPNFTITDNSGTGTLDGNGTATYVPFYADANTLESDAHFYYNKTTDVLHVHGIGGDATDGLLIESENGTDIAILGAANTANGTWYGNHNFEGGLLQIGKNTTTLGQIKLYGNTSGDVTIQPNAIAGTGIVLTAPATTGTLALLSNITGTNSNTNTGDQTITNSSDATSHTVTLSATGGSVQFIEGTNITLTTGGTGSAGTVTIAASGGGLSWEDSVNGGTGTGLALALDNSYASGGIGQSITLGNTQTQNLVALKLDTGTSTGRTHIPLQISYLKSGSATNSTAINSAAIAIDMGTSGNYGDGIALTITPDNNSGQSLLKLNIGDGNWSGTAIRSTYNGTSSVGTGVFLDASYTTTRSSLSARYNTFANFSNSRVENRTTGTTNDDYVLANFYRNQSKASGAGTLTSTGAVIFAENASSAAAGTVTDTTDVLKLKQSSYAGSTGKLINALNNTTPVFTVDKNGNTYNAGTLDLGHASDTTLSRVSAGVMAVEGVRVITSAGTTSGTILKNNGTTFVASTETYAAPGTSGNVMTSDGTNWTSAAPAGGGQASVAIVPKSSMIADTSQADPFATLTITDTTTGHFGSIDVCATITVAKVSVLINANEATKNVKIGVYTDDGQTLKFSGTFSVNATGVVTVTLGAAVQLTPGRYYVVVVGDTGITSAGLNAWETAQSTSGNLTLYNSVASEPVFEGTATVTAATLPTTFNPTTITGNTRKTLQIRFDN